MATLLEKHLKLEEIKKIRNWRNEGYGLEKIKELVDKTNITDEEIEQIFYENSEKTQNEEKLDLLETNENSNKPEQQTERNIKEQNESEFIYNNSEFVSEEVDEDEIEDLEEIEENKIEIEEENTIDDIKVENMENEKYEIVKDNFKEVNGVKVYRIRALKDFQNDLLRNKKIKKGDLGGYIESEKNLSQEGNCWIADNAIVCDNATIKDNSVILDNATVSKYAAISENTTIFEYAKIWGSAKIHGQILIGGHAKIYDHANLHGKLCIGDHVNIFGDANVHGLIVLAGAHFIGNNADIKEMGDVMTILGLDTAYDNITFYRTKSETEISLVYWKFNGITIDEFRKELAVVYYNAVQNMESLHYARELDKICDLAEYHFQKETVNH